MPTSRAYADNASAYTYPLAGAIPTSLMDLGQVPVVEPDLRGSTTNLISSQLLADVDAKVAVIEKLLERVPARPVTDPDDMLVEAPGDVVYRDAYTWHQVHPRIRRGTYRVQADDDPDVWQ